MESELTELEMDAALQLIQLRGDSPDSAETGGGEAKRSRGESSNGLNFSELEALPRRKMRFRLLAEVYGFISPVNKKRAKKSSN